MRYFDGVKGIKVNNIKGELFNEVCCLGERKGRIGEGR